MPDLSFECAGITSDRYAAGPTLLFTLRIAESSGEAVHAMVLRCQIRIEPTRRHYSGEEQDRLDDLFGEPSRWGDTVHPIQLATVPLVVPGFTGRTDATFTMPCSFDLEVAAGKYFASLTDGEIPLLLLFSGTVFTRGEIGFEVHQVPWHHEARYLLPVAVWREMIDTFFPNQGWILARRETLDALRRFRGREALPSWDDTFERLLKEAGEVSR